MHELLNEEFLNESEAAALLSCAIATLRSNAARRRGPPRVKVGRTVLYRKAALLEWITAHEVDPEAPRRAVLAGGGR